MDRETIIDRLRETPEQTTRQIAGELGLNYSATCRLRHELEEAGTIPKMAKGWGRDRQKAAMDTTPEVTEEVKVLDLFSNSEEEAEDLEQEEESYQDMEESAPLTDEGRWDALEKAVRGMYEILVAAPPSLWGNREARKQYQKLWEVWNKTILMMCRFDGPIKIDYRTLGDIIPVEDDGTENADDNEDLLW